MVKGFWGVGEGREQSVLGRGNAGRALGEVILICIPQERNRILESTLLKNSSSIQLESAGTCIGGHAGFVHRNVEGKENVPLENEIYVGTASLRSESAPIRS